MKNIRFFETVEEYRAFVRGLIKTDLLRCSPFYSGVVDWVIDHRTPMFFEASEDCEHAHFTQYFGMVLLRDYQNPYISDLYYLHDMVHQLFYCPVYPRNLSFKAFADLSIGNEVYASNETEVLAYLRTADLREKTFDFPILYDLLQWVGYDCWDVENLAAMRRILQDTDAAWTMFNKYEQQAAQAVRHYMSRVSANWVWCALWYDHVPHLFNKPVWYHTDARLPRESYASVVAGYRSHLTQEHYLSQFSRNMDFWYALTTGKETAIGVADIPKRLADMEGRIAMPEAARMFHQIVQSKQTSY